MNDHTGDHTKPVEREVSVLISTDTHRFSVWCSRESAATLQPDDWAKATSRTQGHVEALVRRCVMNGTYFTSEAQQWIRENAEKAMGRFIYEELRARMQTNGCEVWQVDSLLAGERYRV